MADSVTDRNVYVLGAGASADAGAPLIKDFLDRSRNLLDDPFSGLEEFEKEHFRRVFKFRREMAQAREKVNLDLDDIEQLFGLVEISHRLQDTPLTTRNSMVYLIAKTLQMSINAHRDRRATLRVPYKPEFADVVRNGGNPYRPYREDEQGRISIDAYDFFAGLASGAFDDREKHGFRKDTIITFNYDLVIDHALRRHGIGADYCLSPQNQNDQRGTYRSKFQLLKLHGSTNWGICADCNRCTVVLSDKLTDSPAEFRP